MRRRLTFSLLLVSCLLALLASCASGPREIEIPRQRLQAALEHRFPYEVPAGLFVVTVDVPRLELLPAANRVRLDLPIAAADRIVHRSTHGDVVVSFGLRFERSDHSLRMQDVQVDHVGLQGVPAEWQGLLQAVGAVVATNLLQDAVLHTFSAEEMARARGWTPDGIRVTPTGVRIVLLPPVVFHAVPDAANRAPA